MGGISFPMLSDYHPHGEITRAYNVWNPQRGCPVRSVFILDEAGVVRWAQTYAPGTLPEPQDLFDALDALGR
jgi:alkyl hydroperoxide reductase subunit AhpC